MSKPLKIKFVADHSELILVIKAGDEMDTEKSSYNSPPPLFIVPALGLVT